MTYVEGFLVPVPTANRDAYKAQAEEALPLFQKLGATRFVESWADDVPDGKTNDLKQAVQLKDDETVLFSWIEYPDKATRDTANERLMVEMSIGPADMPFDLQRMIVAGFESIVEEGGGTKPGYIDGFLCPVPAANKDAYLAMASKAAGVFREYGAIRVVEAWGEDTPDGTVTDYNRATLKQDGEKVVYSWIEWPSKQVRDEGWAKVMADPRMQPDGEMPFDGKRMMWGGFAPLLDA